MLQDPHDISTSPEERFQRRLRALEQQKVASTPPRVIKGWVAAAGTVSFGKGFTSVKNSTGIYTISYTVPFITAELPLVFIQPVGGGGTQSNVTAITAGGFSVATFGTTGALIDTQFNFRAELP